MRYLDSELNYTEPAVKPKTRSISYEGMTWAKRNDTYLYVHDDNPCLHLAEGVPNEAIPGEQVSVELYTVNSSNSFYGEWVGWLPVGTPFNTDTAGFRSLNDYKDERYPDSSNPYTFTMPDTDIVVYLVCPGGEHEVGLVPN